MHQVSRLPISVGFCNLLPLTVRKLDHLRDSTSAQLITSIASGHEMHLICTQFFGVSLRMFTKTPNFFTEELPALNENAKEPIVSFLLLLLIYLEHLRITQKLLHLSSLFFFILVCRWAQNLQVFCAGIASHLKRAPLSELLLASFK